MGASLAEGNAERPRQAARGHCRASRMPAAEPDNPPSAKNDLARSPQSSVEGCVARGAARPDNLTPGIHSHRTALGPAEGAEVDHSALLRPREGMAFAVAGERRDSDGLPTVVHRRGGTEAAPQRPKVDHSALLRPGECMDRTVTW